MSSLQTNYSTNQDGGKKVTQSRKQSAIMQSRQKSTLTPISDDTKKRVKENLEDFLSLFILVKYAVLYYKYGILNTTSISVKDHYGSLCQKFINLLDKIPKENNLKLNMINENPLTVVSLNQEMMNFILEEMSNQYFCKNLYTKITSGILGHFTNTKTNYREFLLDNKTILQKFTLYVTTFCFKRPYLKRKKNVDFPLNETIDRLMNTAKNLEDFGNEIAKYIMDNYDYRAAPKPQQQSTQTLVRDNTPSEQTTSRHGTRKKTFFSVGDDVINYFTKLLHRMQGRNKNKTDIVSVH